MLLSVLLSRADLSYTIDADGTASLISFVALSESKKHRRVSEPAQSQIEAPF